MSHDYHEGAPNYNPHQLYYDGCGECKERAEGSYPFEKIDLRAAWLRAIAFEQDALQPDMLPVSQVEARVLRLIWSMAVTFQRAGIPLGLYPPDAVEALRPQRSR